MGSIFVTTGKYNIITKMGVDDCEEEDFSSFRLVESKFDKIFFFLLI